MKSNINKKEKHSFNKDCFKRINTNTEHLHLVYSLLEKKKNEISRSEYVYSLIESSNDKKKFGLIKKEMNLPESSQSAERILKHKYYVPNLNIYNYRNILNAKKSQPSTENEILGSLLSQFEKNITKKLHRDKKVKGITFKPFNLSDNKRYTTANTEGTCSTGLYYQPRTTSHNRTPSHSYFTKTLNSTLYKIITDVQKKEDDCMKTKTDIMHNIIKPYKSKQHGYKLINFCENKKRNGKKGMFSFPLINKIIYGKEDRNDFRDVRQKLYSTYITKKKNNNSEMEAITNENESVNEEDH